jgi:hypothetical protein
MIKFILVYHGGMNSKLPGSMVELGISTNHNRCTMVYPKKKHIFFKYLLIYLEKSDFLFVLFDCCR